MAKEKIKPAFSKKDLRDFYMGIARDHNIEKTSLKEQTAKALAGKEAPQASINEQTNTRTAPEIDAR